MKKGEQFLVDVGKDWVEGHCHDVREHLQPHMQPSEVIDLTGLPPTPLGVS